jgi:hypothetical protein
VQAIGQLDLPPQRSEPANNPKVLPVETFFPTPSPKNSAQYRDDGMPSTWRGNYSRPHGLSRNYCFLYVIEEN